MWHARRPVQTATARPVAIALAEPATAPCVARLGHCPSRLTCPSTWPDKTLTPQAEARCWTDFNAGACSATCQCCSPRVRGKPSAPSCQGNWPWPCNRLPASCKSTSSLAKACLAAACQPNVPLTGRPPTYWGPGANRPCLARLRSSPGSRSHPGDWSQSTPRAKAPRPADQSAPPSTAPAFATPRRAGLHRRLVLPLPFNVARAPSACNVRSSI